jgi:hypothetical protein
MSPNITVITKFKGNVQLAEGGGHFYIVWVTGSGEPEIERELTRELCWLTAYTLDNLERLDFNRFDLRPETASELDYEQERLAAEEKSERDAQADQVPARVWLAELKAKYHSQEGIQELMREHSNDSMPNCVLRECANVPHIRNVHDANGNWVLNINGCEPYIRSQRWGGGDNNNTTITIGNRRGQKDPVEPRCESQFDFIDGELRYHYKSEDMEEL